MSDVPETQNEMVLPQNVVAPLTRAAIFLVVCIRRGPDACALLRSFCADLSGLIRAAELRDFEAGLTCVVGFGSRCLGQAFWIATARGNFNVFETGSGASPRWCPIPGDILFHIPEPNAWTSVLKWRLRSWTVSGRQFRLQMRFTVSGNADDRDVIGFVDGTENPRGEAYSWKL